MSPNTESAHDVESCALSCTMSSPQTASSSIVRKASWCVGEVLNVEIPPRSMASKIHTYCNVEWMNVDEPDGSKKSVGIYMWIWVLIGGQKEDMSAEIVGIYGHIQVVITSSASFVLNIDGILMAILMAIPKHRI